MSLQSDPHEVPPVLKRQASSATTSPCSRTRQVFSQASVDGLFDLAGIGGVVDPEELRRPKTTYDETEVRE